MGYNQGIPLPWKLLTRALRLHHTLLRFGGSTSWCCLLKPFCWPLTSGARYLLERARVEVQTTMVWYRIRVTTLVSPSAKATLAMCHVMCQSKVIGWWDWWFATSWAVVSAGCVWVLQSDDFPDLIQLSWQQMHQAMATHGK